MAARHKSTSPVKNSISFAFDIDGVLLKSSKPIPGATDALKLLRKHNIPFILLTNGGGLSEKARVSDLTRYLDIPISASQFIQSHTPFQGDISTHGYRNVLVCGGVLDTCRQVALGYGFPHVTIPFDVLARDGAIWPYHALTGPETACAVPLGRDPIDAIYVFHDPRDWGLDSQVILDVLLSRGGRVGTRQVAEQAVPIYFSNPDLLWANAYALPRFGQGAFQILIEGLYRATTGRELVSTTIGKPSDRTYKYADDVLRRFRSQSQGSAQPLVPGNEKVYMVGDNKLSDIQGANDFGWDSILVRTGVFDGTPEEGRSGDVPAKYCVADVQEAVEMVLLKEGII
ncbi:Putative uncharacterized protein [Taphrina deformans PYCC 5710]|uniref:Uncharacterized protein n=1 Tax=Taphrina deformans (strain PYCC 5710 / ATCC 11124 / CBS 356.35 / IMI 108563 / JCM 9778 / NBRC 8474) TaxID=1097556 RepID=R4XBS5_TAPDE|nr:Putative uncharacterized protein [Taphrina deformans PYCC 5710]|eukprot:CCG83025.1 Putative uncharacterized protein [Taphrina deformans PYCC 5710]